MDPAPHPFSLRQLQYAVAVAELLSFRKAAEACRVAQPSLSAQLAQLESAVGLRLFERDRRKVLVNPAARGFLSGARDLLAAADALLPLARGSSDPLSGTLRLGIIPTAAPYLVPGLARAFRKAHAALTVHWVEEKTQVLLASLLEGAIEAALLAIDGPSEQLERVTILRDPFVLAAPRGHPLARSSDPIRFSELRGHDLLLLDDGHCFRDQALDVCRRGRAHEASFRATSLGTLVQMVADGSGATLLPSLAIKEERRKRELVVRTFHAPGPARTLGLVFRKRSPLSDGLRRLAATAREVASPDLPRAVAD